MNNVTRRTFSALLAAGGAAPFVSRSWAREDPLEEAIAALDQLHSLQVQIGPNLVFAEAPRGGGLSDPANIKSCSKSLVALLLGTCLDRGEIGSIQDRLRDVAPKLVPSDADGRVAGLTMENLVTLSAGLEPTSGAEYGAWVSSPNWVADALSRPMIAEPGTRMIYSTGTTHILGAVLSEVTGKSLLELARERLGEPLGFDVSPWIADPQGFYLGGNEMSITPEAMLKVALMMRDGGIFDGETIIPSGWIRSSKQPRVRSPYSGMRYGYGWFVTDSGYVLARGYGGQIIAAHEEAHLAVAITSDPNRPARTAGYFGDLITLLDGPILEMGST